MFSQKEGQIPAFYCNLASHYKCKHEGQVLVSRLSKVFKLYSKDRSFLVNMRSAIFFLYLTSLLVFITAKTKANCSEILAHSTCVKECCYVSRECVT